MGDDSSHHQMAHPGLHENEICNSRRFEGRTRSSGSSRSNDRYNLNSKFLEFNNNNIEKAIRNNYMMKTNKVWKKQQYL
jgi:hypothetical protein